MSGSEKLRYNHHAVAALFQLKKLVLVLLMENGYQ